MLLWGQFYPCVVALSPSQTLSASLRQAQTPLGGISAGKGTLCSFLSSAPTSSQAKGSVAGGLVGIKEPCSVWPEGFVGKQGGAVPQRLFFWFGPGSGF